MANNAVTATAAAISYIGCVRANNEDNFLFNGTSMHLLAMDTGSYIKAVFKAPVHLFAVADGMGGMNGGEYASFITVEALKRLFPALSGKDVPVTLKKFVRDSSVKILEDAKKRQVAAGGATLAMVFLDGNIAHVFNVGDSRVYMLRLGRLVQISYDHTHVYQRMLRGELTRRQLQAHPNGHAIYQYIGMPAAKASEDCGYYRAYSLCNGDRFVVCTDGISDLIPHERMETLVSAHADPAQVARELVLEAAELGGKDNATCIVLDICSPQLPIQTPSDLALLDIMLTNDATTEKTLQ